MRARAGCASSRRGRPRPSAGLAHVGLGRSVRGRPRRGPAALSPPRRRALEVALLLRGARRRPGRSARARGCGARRAAAAQRARAGLCRRSTTSSGSTRPRRARSRSRCGGSARDHVRLLLARRLADGAQPSELEQALGAERVQRLPVGPLSVGALHRFLRDRLGRSFARQTLLRIHERSGGNPFFALELARVLDADVDPLAAAAGSGDARGARAREDLRASRAHARGARARLGARARRRSRFSSGRAFAQDALDAGGRRARDRARERDDPLHPSAAVVGSLPGPGRGAAERARADRGDRRRPAPPRPSPRAVDGRAGRRRRRRARRRREPGGRSRRVGRRGRARRAGAPADAAGRGATSAIVARWPRLVRIRLPGSGRARGRSRPTCWPRPRSARCAPRRSSSSPSSRAVDRRRRAARGGAARGGVAPGASVASSTAGSRGRRASGTGSRSARARARGARARRGARRRRAAGRRAHACSPILGCDRWATPRRRRTPRGRTTSRRAVGDAAAACRRRRSPSSACSRRRRRSRRRRALLEREYRGVARARRAAERARALGALLGRVLGRALGARGRLRRPRARHRDPVRARGAAGPPPVAVDRRPSRPARARARAFGASAASSPRSSSGSTRPSTWRSSGSSRSGAETLPTAAEWLDTRRPAGGRRSGGASRACRWWSADYVEALLELGRIDDAVRVLDVWEADATRLGRDWVLAQVTRCRGLVAAAQGDVDEAASPAGAGGRAARGASAIRFGRARALLALGVVRRRARQKRAARDAIGAALGGFEQLGAATLGREGARRARQHRRAHARGGADGGRAPRRRPGRRGPDEPGGRRRAVPRRADGRQPPDAHLRQARRALAHRARPPAALTTAPAGKVQTF